MGKNNSDKNNGTAAKTAAPSQDHKTLTVPDGDVLLRRIAGPDGVHPTCGYVKHGRLYTVEFPLAVRFTAGKNPEFEAVYVGDRQRIQAATKAATDQ